MKEFSNVLMIIPADKTPTEIKFPYSEFIELHSNVEVKPTCKNKNVTAGGYYEFGLRITLDELPTAANTLMANSRPIVLLLFDGDGNPLPIGSQSLPIAAETNGVGFNSEVNFSGKLLKNPL